MDSDLLTLAGFAPCLLCPERAYPVEAALLAPGLIAATYGAAPCGHTVEALFVITVPGGEPGTELCDPEGLWSGRGSRPGRRLWPLYDHAVCKCRESFRGRALLRRVRPRQEDHAFLSVSSLRVVLPPVKVVLPQARRAA